ncbi:zingipain-2-like [Macadamia integrifolia]|uniref:zingipain-2-like n=1 Tax=Macadamia integrifolia TaxID=60698 RepID=UPI001C4F08C8|nr:zingipain-2-like [Macadamia integrifolia]
MEMRKVALFVALSMALVLGLVQSFEFHERELETEESLWDLYERWCSHHKVSRDPSEKQMRFRLFKDNAKYVLEFNKKDAPYKLELNKFSDMNEREKNVLSGYRLSRESRTQLRRRRGTVDDNFMYHHNKLIKDIPSSIDWREKGVVASVKDQGSCGSCWAFSTAAAVESINKIVAGELVDLSPQQLIDCVTVGCDGCCGGYYGSAFEYIVNNNGITTLENYPYAFKNLDWHCDHLKQNLTCQPSKVLSPLVTIDDFEEVPSNNESALKEAVAQQPVSVIIDDSLLLLYKQGIIVEPCGTNPNHGVTIVGYGTDTETGLDYWIVKNSRGAAWGENGYFRIQRGISAEEGLCGIAMGSFYPIKSSTGISFIRAAESSLEDIH